MEVSAVVAAVAGVATGRSTVLSSVMVVLRLSVARASRLAVEACACAGADSDAKRPRLSAQIERRLVVLSRARPTSLVMPPASMVRVPMADSAKEVRVVRIRFVRMHVLIAEAIFELSGTAVLDDGID